MERKIGEIFEYNGEWYQCVKGISGERCADCSFQASPICIDLNCIGYDRKDHTKVIFKKLEKVGEPFTIGGNLFQHCKVFDIENVCGDAYSNVHNYNEKTVLIEIKQNKEDMKPTENRFTGLSQEEIDKIYGIGNKEDMKGKELDPHMEKVIDESMKKMGDEISRQLNENINKQKIKPFSIEDAKNGKPVCTRDGRKARIVCFDAKYENDYKPIIALIDNGINEFTVRYTKYGECSINAELDLMMLPEKKKGWVNVYYNRIDGTTFSKHPYPSKEEAIKNAGTISNRIDTVKIFWEE